MQPHIPQLSVLLVLLATPVICFTTYHANCTLPDGSYNYFQSPNVRGTLDIVWSCLATLIACTYTVLHLNVPEQRDGRDPGFKGDLKWWWKGIRPSLEWTFTAMVAPEWYALMASANLIVAMSTKADLVKLDKSISPPGGWSLSSAFFANMGGFAIRSNTNRRDNDITHLTGKHLLQLLKDQTYSLIPNSLPSTEEIKDLSKSDDFAKTLVMLQMIYFCANCLTRLIKGMPTTQLEMSVFGTAVCSLVSFVVLFRKPHSVKTVKILMTFDGKMPQDIKKIFKNRYQTHSKNGTIRNLGHRIDRRSRWDTFVAIGLAIVLGAFHVAAWNFAFPSDADRWIWRVCSLLSCVLVPAYVGLAIMTKTIVDYIPNQNIISSAVSKWADDLGLMGLLFLYIMLRLILAAEMIRFLFYLPPGALKSTWADNIPHI
ncbi:hypothetical protein Q7P37_004787 [Cladosporium fusiforme]